jgi:hypothetical protein
MVDEYIICPSFQDTMQESGSLEKEAPQAIVHC